MDTVLTNVALWNSDLRIAQAAHLRIRNGKVSDISFGPLPSSGNDTIIDMVGRIAIPGFVNSHTHSESILARGTLGDGAVEHLMGNRLGSHSGRSPDDAYFAAQLNAIECLRTGTTSVIDMFTLAPIDQEHIDAVGEAYRDIGIRAVIVPQYRDLPTSAAFPGLADLLPNDLYAKLTEADQLKAIDMTVLAESASKWSNVDGRISFGLGPVAASQCSDSLLDDTVSLSRELNLGIYTHLAESRLGTVAANRRFHGRPIEYLAEIGILGSRTVAAHCVWLTRRDMALLAEAGVVAVHCPSSNLRLGAGVARVRSLLNAGVSVVLGSDGAVCSDHLNMFETTRSAAQISRILSPRIRDWLSPFEALSMATSPAGLKGTVNVPQGQLTVSSTADIVFLDPMSTYLQPPLDLVERIVLSESGAGVTDVMVGGNFVLRDRMFTTINEPEVIDYVASAASAMVMRNQEGWQLSERVRPYLDTLVETAGTEVWRPAQNETADWSPESLSIPF